MKSFLDFFVNDNLTGMSMSRLLMFGCFVVSSAIMGTLTSMGQMNEAYFAMYIGAWSGTYMVGKGIDMKASRGA